MNFAIFSMGLLSRVHFFTLVCIPVKRTTTVVMRNIKITLHNYKSDFIKLAKIPLHSNYADKVHTCTFILFATHTQLDKIDF